MLYYFIVYSVRYYYEERLVCKNLIGKCIMNFPIRVINYILFYVSRVY